MMPASVKSHHCPNCGELTLQHQEEVVWCSNLRPGHKRACGFGVESEKTLDDLPQQLTQ